MIVAFLIFAVTITLVIWQPRGLQIGWSAMGGAAAALLLGVVTLADIPVVWDIVWNATATFVAIIIISLLLDEAGFFEWAALHVGRWGGGRGRRLFILFVLLGAVFLGAVSFKVVHEARESNLPDPTSLQCQAEMIQMLPVTRLGLMLRVWLPLPCEFDA